MKMIELTKLLVSRRNHSDYTDTDDPTEANAPTPQAPMGHPVMVNVDLIQCFYRRRNDAPGTRITFIGGRGMVVMEHYSEVKALLDGTQILLDARTPNAEGSRTAQ